MNFHWPFVLLALPLVLAALLALFVRSYRARQRLLGQFASLRLLPALLTSYSPSLRRVKHALVISGVLLVIFALARPQWGYDWQEQRARGVDVMFVVDTSKSMLTQDVLPSRLERAKLAIIDLVEKMQGNRVGLVAFAGQAFLQCPLTLDYDAFRQSLEAVDVTTITQGGTNIAAGLNEAAAALENSGNHKVIVLLTDGEDLEGEGIATAKTLRDQGVTIYTVGVGTPQGDIIPLAGKDGQVDFVRDDHGQIVKSHLDAATLTAIAQASNNGFYEPLGATGEGLTQVYEAGIKTMPEQQTTSRLQQLPLERFQWPLALALFFLALDPLIGTRRPSWARRAAIRENASVVASISAPAPKSSGNAASSVITLLLAAALWTISARPAHAQAAVAPPAPDTASPAPSTDTTAPSASAASVPDNAALSTPDSPLATSAPASTPLPASPAIPVAPPASAKLAEQLYRQGDYKAAAVAYGEAADAHPQDGRFRYDQGASLYRSGDFDAASQAFQQTLSANNLGLQQQAYYGLGNSRYRLGQAELKQDPKKTVSTWESATKDYQNALELNPGDPDAHYNLDLLKTQLAQLKKQLEQQQKQQQQQQQNQPDQNQQDQQNQQNQNQQQQNQQSQQNQSSSQQNSSQNQQSQQQKSRSQQSQQNQQSQNQSGQQNQQQQSGQQGQQNQQNQSQQNQSQQNRGQQSRNSSGNPQSPQNQNQPGQNQKPGQNQSPQNSSGQNPPQQSQPGQQKSNQGPQPAPGQPNPQKPNPAGGQQSQPQPGQNPQQGQQPSPQPQNSGKPSGNSTAGQAAGTGQKPAQPGTAAAAGGAASGDKSGENGNVTVAVPGAMTREEARQVLDSLKNSERKLPVTNYDSQKEGAQDTSSPGFKDW